MRAGVAELTSGSSSTAVASTTCLWQTDTCLPALLVIRDRLQMHQRAGIVPIRAP